MDHEKTWRCRYRTLVAGVSLILRLTACFWRTLCQIASITKVMTAVLVLKAADVEPGVCSAGVLEFWVLVATVSHLPSHPYVQLLEEYILVSADSAGVGGTSATLRTGEVYTVKDLLYGMMLPSGNDAASALAEYLGDSFAPPPAHTWASTPPYVL